MTGCGRSVRFKRTEPRGYSDLWEPTPMHFVCGVEGLCPSCAAKLQERAEELEKHFEAAVKAVGAEGRKRWQAGAERDAAIAEKAKLVEAVKQAVDYVRAYKCQVDAIEGIPGASKWLKKYGP